MATHVGIEFGFLYSDIIENWIDNSNTIVVLSASDEQELYELYNKAKDNDDLVLGFREPDMDNELVSIALFPSKELLRDLKSLPLCLKNVRADWQKDITSIKKEVKI